ncbi:MAG: SRPBCC family protein [Oricola sp.]
MTVAENTLTIERILDAPRMAIWRCWTEPDLLMQWFTPKPWQTVGAEIDLRPGGASVITMRSPEGEDFPNPGVYLDVVPGEKLVFTDAFTSAWEPSGKAFMVGEIALADAPGGKTRYLATVRHWSAEDRKSHEDMGFYPGWNAAADQLEELAKTL